MGALQDVITKITDLNMNVIGILSLLIGLVTIYLMIKPTDVIIKKDESKEVVKDPDPKPKPTPIPPQEQKNWLTIKVEKHADSTGFQLNLTIGNCNHDSIQLDQLPTTHDHVNWQIIAKSLFEYSEIQQAYESGKTVHLRIMTDDAELAYLPWHCLPHPETQKHFLDSDWVIEVSPVQHESAGFFSPTISNPLIVIPIDKEHKLTGDKHYAQVQGYFESQFKINGFIPRLNTAKQLRRELKRQQPDLLYFYAQAENGKILLDQDSQGENSLSFEELGDWIKEAGICPIVIISLVSNKEISEYPVDLIEKTSLLWVLVATHTSKIEVMEQQLFNVFEQLLQNGDISALIKQHNNHAERRVQSIVWNSGQSLKLEIDQTDQRRRQQFRAALLRIVLGREELKDQLTGGIGRSIKKTNMLVYAISGIRTASPFDVPAQVRNQLQYGDYSQFPVIPYYFNIHIAPNPDSISIENSIDDAISYGLLNGSPDPAEIFRAEINRRAYNNQECCITFNWFFDVPDEMQGKLTDWVKQWMNAICSEFDSAVPEKALLIHALCLQVDTPEAAEKIQEMINKTLGKWRNEECRSKYLKVSQALGKLDETEISQFFSSNKLWRESLNIDKKKINYDDYSHWVYQNSTNGEFETVVKLIWHQYKTHYREYLNAETIN